MIPNKNLYDMDTGQLSLQEFFPVVTYGGHGSVKCSVHIGLGCPELPPTSSCDVAYIWHMSVESVSTNTLFLSHLVWALYVNYLFNILVAFVVTSIAVL